ncbi:MAG: putative Ig domain-containing protein [Bryobacteraceae bacterium]
MRSLRALLLTLVFAAIPAAAQTITTTSMPNGTVNVAYSFQLGCTNCAINAVWSISPASGPLPPNLGINPSSGVISGVPTTSGSYPFLAQVQNPAQAPVTQALTINIVGPITITTSSFPNGTLNNTYTSPPLAAKGGIAPYTWILATGPLPPGLGLSSTPSGTVIAGVPTAVGTYQFILEATDNFGDAGTAVLSISIVSGVAITTTALPNGVVGQVYNVQLTCAACTGYTWSISSGTLPPVLSISPSGDITGTPTTVGTFTFSVSLSSTSPPISTVTQPLSITINPPLEITPATLPVATVNVPYSTTILGTGGSPPYTWSFTSTANAGLKINSSSGVISGTPTVGGQYTLGVMLADSGGLSVTRLFILYVASTLSVTTTSLANGTVGTVYPTQTLAATGGQQPYVWSVPPAALPPGLLLNAKPGTITGTPTSAGTYPFTMTVTDTLGNIASASLSITVAGSNVTITISPTTLTGGTVGVAYSQALTASGGAAPYTWSIFSSVLSAAGPPAGALPAGLTLNPATGVISGTPTAAGTFGFTVQAIDSNKASGLQALSIVIAPAPPLTVTTTSLPGGTVGTAYSQTLAATGGLSPYTWSVPPGTLPAGLGLNATTGAITGTPTAAATSSFTVTVTDSVKNTAQHALSIAIAAAVPPLTVTASALPAATVGIAYTESPLTVSGGTPPYAYSFGALNSNAVVTTNTDGLKINPSTGAISGTPIAAGQFTLPVIVNDSSSPVQTSAQNLPLTVNSAPPPTVTLTGVPPSSGFDQQVAPTLSISAAYPTALTGTIVLTFAPSVTPPQGSTGAIDDLMIQFSNGSRTIDFTIPAGSTTPTLNNASSITVLTGTTAGAITLTTTLTDSSGATLGSPSVQTIVNNAAVPFIDKVTLTQVPGGVTVTVTGFSSTRDMNNGQFAFVPGTGDSFANPSQTSGILDVSVALNGAFTTWWADPAQANPFGTQFTLTVPFTQTNAAGASVPQLVIVSVTVTLSNSKGASNPVSLSQ